MRMLSNNCERRKCSPVSPFAKELVRRLDSSYEIHWMKLILLLFNEFTRIFALSYVFRLWECARRGLCAREYAVHSNLRLHTATVSPCEFIFFISNRISSGVCLSLRLIMRTASAVNRNSAEIRVFATTDHEQCAKEQRHAFWRWFLFISAIRPSNWFRMRIRRTHCERPPIGNCFD